MKLFSFCTSLLLAGALLFVTSAKPIADKKHDKPLSAYPPITVKNNTGYRLNVALNYGLNFSTHPKENIEGGATLTFPSRGLQLLYKILICCPVPIGLKPIEFVEWKKGVGCGKGCSNFTINAIEDNDKLIFSVTQD